jgi:hypothetical protein
MYPQADTTAKLAITRCRTLTDPAGPMRGRNSNPAPDVHEMLVIRIASVYVRRLRTCKNIGIITKY